jgi:peptide/nickel transport system permease protein
MKSTIKIFFRSFFTIFIAISIVFFALRFSPGDPIERLLGPLALEEDIKKYRDQLGLNETLFNQYKSYLWSLITFNLGESLFRKEQVGSLIKVAFIKTGILAFFSMLISSFVGIFFGVLAGNYKNKFIDFFLRSMSLLGMSIPVFCLAPVLVIIFSLQLGLFPVSEWGDWRHLFLPTLTLVIPLSCFLIKVTRTQYLENNQTPWIQVLIAKGLSPFSIRIRILKVILPTLLNVIGLQLSVVLAGTMITETLYDIPGVGSLLFEAINNRDYPLVQGIIVYTTCIYLMVYYLIDFLNEKIDPRISYEIHK